MTNATNTKVLVVTADSAFADAMRGTFGASKAIDLVLVEGALARQADTLAFDGTTVVLVDFDPSPSPGSDAPRPDGCP